MRRNWRSNRLLFLIVCLMLCGGLIVLSRSGIIRPLEDIIGTPLRFLSERFNHVALSIDNALNTPQDVVVLQERIAALEEALADIQAENIELREIASDYERLSALLDYTSNFQNREFVTADVIGVDTQSSIRTIIINRGTRDGLDVGMPVQTELGLVGRIFELSANSALVQLVTDGKSAISGRLQTSRAEGSVQGRGILSGNMRMRFIPVDNEINIGDLVVTSGLGGNFPPDVVIGQVTSRRNFEFELSQEAEVNSLIDFARLEFVLVNTSFEPADISVFEEPES